MARWDSPLFTLLWTDDDLPEAEMWKAITSGDVKPPNSGTLSVGTPTSLLYHL